MSSPPRGIDASNWPIEAAIFILIMREELKRWSLFAWLRRLSHPRYELTDGRIVKYQGRRTLDSIELAKITAWFVEYEMIFDFVVIRLGDDRQLVWLDYENDLLAIVRGELRHLEIECP